MVWNYYTILYQSMVWNYYTITPWGLATDWKGSVAEPQGVPKLKRLEEEESPLNLGVTSEAKGKTRREGKTSISRRKQSITSNAIKRLGGNKEGSIGFGEKIIKDLDKNHFSVEMSAEVLFESGINRMWGKGENV